MKNILSGYKKEYQNLQLVGVSGGNWIDAGCGQGAYTVPLSKLADSVIALDINKSNLKSLEEQLRRLNITNVSVLNGDLTNIDLYQNESIGGILFAFSIHYQKNLEFIKEILKLKEPKQDFKLIILEYTRTTPVYWVPYPVPPEKIEKLVQYIENYQNTIKFRNNRYYIMEIRKNVSM